MELFAHTLKCPKWQVKEEEKEEVEVTEAETEVEEEFEEEEILEDVASVDYVALNYELECMKRRIQSFQLQLKPMIELDKCPEEPCVDPEVELTCSENKEICQLQKNHSKLQYQLNKLIECAKISKEQIADLRSRMCEKTREVLELRKMIGELMAWKNNLEHEFGMCIERFEYLKHVKSEWKDVKCMLEKQSEYIDNIHREMVQKHCYVEDMRQLREEVTLLQNFFNESYTENAMRMEDLEKNFKCIAGKMEQLSDAVENLKLKHKKAEIVKYDCTGKAEISSLEVKSTFIETKLDASVQFTKKKGHGC